VHEGALRRGIWLLQLLAATKSALLHNGSTFSCEAQLLPQPAEASTFAARRYHGPTGISWASTACNVRLGGDFWGLVGYAQMCIY